jgi:hypothetical protein
VERNNERKRWNHRLQGSKLEKDKTITPSKIPLISSQNQTVTK